MTKRLLAGIGLDGADGHTRITKGDNFHLVGGSKETHEQMQECAIKFTEALKRTGTDFHTAPREKICDIMQSVLEKAK